METVRICEELGVSSFAALGHAIDAHPFCV
jgi:hypothetical protein